MTSLFYIAALFGSVWLFYWLMKIENKGVPKEDRSPFAIRSAEDFRKRYGDKPPF